MQLKSKCFRADHDVPALPPPPAGTSDLPDPVGSHRDHGGDKKGPNTGANPAGVQRDNGANINSTMAKHTIVMAAGRMVAVPTKGTGQKASPQGAQGPKKGGQKALLQGAQGPKRGGQK